MSLHSRKLDLIEEFIRISDESLIEKIESLIQTEKMNQADREQKPMSLETFYKLIDQSREDKVQGNVISHEDLKNRVNSWK